MKGAGLFKVLTYFLLFVLYIYLFGWNSVQRFILGEVVIGRNVVHSQTIKPPGNDTLYFCLYKNHISNFRNLYSCLKPHQWNQLEKCEDSARWSDGNSEVSSL